MSRGSYRIVSKKVEIAKQTLCTFALARMPKLGATKTSLPGKTLPYENTVHHRPSGPVVDPAGCFYRQPDGCRRSAPVSQDVGVRFESLEGQGAKVVGGDFSSPSPVR